MKIPDWCREDTKSCFVFFHLHWQLDHHADDPLPAGSKVKAFILTDPAHTQRVFSQIHIKARKLAGVFIFVE